ncbi:MAG: SMC-Scp complex subunit ScpB [Nanoarchaeota archaeon]
MGEISEKTIEEIDTSKEAEAINKIEASLFVSGKWMSIPELVTLVDLNPILLKQYLERLRDKYQTSAIEICNRDEMWKMGVRTEYSYLINRLATGSSEFTKAEQETLAIIAYKQPVKQSVIINIRGNKAYEHIKKFREIGLVKTKAVGHTIELELSDQFYEYFQINPKTNEEEIGNIGQIEEKEE